MMQINMKAVADLLAERGIDLADHPDLAAQIMVANERLAEAPEITLDVFNALLAQLTTAADDS